MRIPQVADRVIGAPGQALRNVLRGVGRLLLTATGDPDQPEDQAQARWRSLDTTGNVRVLSPDELDEGVPADEALPADNTGSLPIPGYDALSLPSLRARLRGLDTAQLRVLADYEAAHAARQDVLGMFERRIAKLAGS